MTLTTVQADAIDSMIERMRTIARELAQENDRLRAENKRLVRENLELLDQLQEAREQAARAGAL